MSDRANGASTASRQIVSLVSGGAGAASGALFVARWLISILLGAVSFWWRWSRAYFTDAAPHRRSVQKITQQMSPIISSAIGAVAGSLFVVLWLTRIVLCSASGVARPVFFRDRTEHPFACLRFSP
jgi:hypothetical protein